MRGTTFLRKTLHWNRTWPYNPQNTSGPRRNQGRQAKTLEKSSYRTEKCLKNTIAWLKCQIQVANGTCRRPATPKVKPDSRRATHAPSSVSHASACGGFRRRKNQRVVCLPVPGFHPEVDWGMAHLMVGSPNEVVTGKVHRKIFLQRQGFLIVVEGFEAFYDKGVIAEKGLRH